METKNSTTVRDACKFLPWRHLNPRLSIQLFNTLIYQQYDSGSWTKLRRIYLIKLIWPADSIKCKGLLLNHQNVFILLSSPILSLWLYPILCPASAVRCIWSMKATHHCDVEWLLLWVLLWGQGPWGHRSRGRRCWLKGSWHWWAHSRDSRLSCCSLYCCCCVRVARGE